MKRLFALPLWLLPAAVLAQTATVTPALTPEPQYQLRRGTTLVGTPKPSLAACHAGIEFDVIARAAGASYNCQLAGGTTSVARWNYTATYTPPCPAKPADETRTAACTSPQTGSWSQTRTYTTAPAPTCWIAGNWLPAAPPAGACVDPPPPPPPASSVSIWPAMNPAVAAAPNDASAVNLGMRFRSSVAGSVTGVRFYKGPGNTGTHVGALWSATGQLLAQGTFTNETATGIQQLLFASPVAISADTAYTVSYRAPVGRYAINEGFAWPVVAAPLTGEAGVYVYGALAFPSATWQASNYWVDVVFAPGPVAPCPAKPADETRATQCAAPQTGSWTQTRTYASAPSPTCWTASAWLPAAAPAGACVTPPATGTATLTWDASPDARVTGYRVYSRQAGPFPVTGADVNTNTYTYSALPSGTWCFAVTAVAPVDGVAVESVQSAEACKTIP